jgi:hypothetical protein
MELGIGEIVMFTLQRPTMRDWMLECLVFSRKKSRAGSPEKEKPSTLTGKVLGSGDVLLSHDLSSHYHRGCSVSLPCSEWERVGPLRYCHQSPMPDWLFAACAARSVDADLWGLASDTDALQFNFERTRSSIGNPQSKIRNLFWLSDIYIQAFGFGGHRPPLQHNFV